MKVASALLLLMCVAATARAEDEKWPQPRWSGWCEFTWMQDKEPPSVLNLPAWACESAFQRSLHEKYAVSTEINPFYLSGDFNADGRIDVAVWITNTQTKQKGIVILHQGNVMLVVIGAGTALFERGEDYFWVDLWSVIPKGDVLESIWEDGRKVELRGEALELVKSESSSHAIYWDGNQYNEYWLSD